MPEGTVAPATAPAPTLANFGAIVAQNTANAPAPAPAAAQTPLPPPVGARDPATGLSETAAAFNAQLEQGAPAPAADQQPAQTTDEQLAAELAGTDKPAASDEWTAEVVPGVSAKDAIEAMKRGELPEALLTQLKGVARINGRELPISFREALNGYMRQSDYTRGTTEIADQVEKLNTQKQALLQLFNGWNQEDGTPLGQSLEKMGLLNQARAAVTRNWGTPDKPSIEGFMDDMRRMGRWDLFKQAAVAHSGWFDARYRRYGGTYGQNPQADEAARRAVAEDEQQHQQLWGARIQAETAAQQAQRQAFEHQNQQTLATQQTQDTSQQQGQQQFLIHVHSLKTSAFGVVKLQATPVADRYFVENLQAGMRLAQLQGTQKPIEQLVSEAVQSTLEQLGDDRHSQGGNGASQGAPQQQQQSGASVSPVARPPSLSARPQGAPITQASSVPRGGTPADFDRRLTALKELRR